MTNHTTLPGLLAEIANGLAAEAAHLEAAALSVARNLAASAVADFEDVIRIGVPLAVEAVIGEAANLISGREKFGNAVASVMQQLEATLGPVAIQDVQALVQLAFRSLPAIAAAL